jgi:hypothetical protein
MIPEKVWDEIFHDFSLRIDALGMLDVLACVLDASTRFQRVLSCRFPAPESIADGSV